MSIEQTQEDIDLDADIVDVVEPIDDVDDLDADQETEAEAEVEVEAEAETESQEEEDYTPYVKPVPQQNEISSILSAVEEMKTQQVVASLTAEINTAEYMKNVLHKQLVEAVESGDTEKAIQLSNNIASNTIKLNELSAKKTDLTAPEAIRRREAEAEQRQFDEALNGFQKRNGWFHKDKEAAEDANLMFDGLVARGVPRVQAVSMVEEKMAKRLNIKERKPASKEKIVASSIKPSRSVPASGYVYSNLRDDVKKQFNEDFKESGFSDKKSYWESYKTYLPKNSYKVQ